jgi:hypothetical protein
MTDTTLLFHTLILTLNIYFFISSNKIFSFFYNDDEKVQKMVFLSRNLNLLFFLFHLLDLFSIIYYGANFNSEFLKVSETIIVIYISIIIISFIDKIIIEKIGKKKEIDGEHIFEENHSSRIIMIVSKTMMVILNMYLIISIWSLNSLLETTSIIGILIGLLALTSSIWVPDIYYGLIMLKSKLFNIGDVIKYDGDNDEYIIYQISLVYTVLLDIRNEHRTIIRNSVLINQKIENLSKLSATSGLRCSLNYKIGYPEDYNVDNLITYKKNIRNMINNAFKEATNNPKIHIRENINDGPEIFMKETGDYAIEWVVNFHLEHLPKTKITKKIREIIIGTPLLINELIFDNSIKNNIDLSTPSLKQLSFK